MSLFRSLTELPDWEVRYQALIEAGKSLPDFPETMRIPTYKVSGCTAPTWIHLLLLTDSTIQVQGYSKSHIVQGLIALLAETLSKKNIDFLNQLHLEFFSPLNLQELISPTRQNGFASMIQHLQKQANSRS